jgi:hypothetical protein
MDGEISVEIAGRRTPVVLTSRGPELSEADVERFERRLGHRLPADYREFLLNYNGGRPVVGHVIGRDDDPERPYQHGDGVSVFFSLPTESAPVSEYEVLRAPADIPWDYAKDVLPIAEDGGGNCFVYRLGEPKGEIRFLNHEEMDEPVEQHRVMANNFLDLLLRVRSLEEDQAIRKAEWATEKTAIERGKFPSRLEAQCRAVESRQPQIRNWIRMVTLRIFERKGHFSVHDDDLSRLLLDLAFWMHQNARPEERASKRTELATMIMCWHRDSENGFGLAGYAPDFLKEWWTDRLSKGVLEGNVESAHLTAQASGELLQRLRSMQEEA